MKWSETALSDRRRSAAMPPQDRWLTDKRVIGLSRFAIAITVLNLLGHTLLGFEQSWLTPIVAIAAAYATELVGETADARATARTPRYAGGVRKLLIFLLSAHISGLAVGMLLYAQENLYAIAFASSLAIASKYILRVPVLAVAGGRTTMRHFLNPSNFGITATLLLFPTVGIAPPYHFTTNTSGLLDILLPLIVICTGSYLNIKATGRFPLVLAWVAAFSAQGLIRAAIHDTPMLAALMPMSGFAFILFTFYMITDPATTPASPRRQVVFAVAVAAGYALFMELHVVFGLFYALTAVTALRGLILLGSHLRGRAERDAAARPRAAAAPRMTPAE